MVLWKHHQHFNPRSHERSDFTAYTLVLTGCKFQSTLPREERRHEHHSRYHFPYFNPRSHERSDLIVHICRSHTAFQSTLPREERLLLPTDVHCTDDFNPRSHERSDHGKCWVCFFTQISIHAPTRGATAILHKKFVYFYTIPTINI